MSKLFSILFSCLVLLQSLNISFDDISKFNILLEHANYHYETYGDSFMEFLAEHYTDSNINQRSNHEQHKNLPFKQHHDCTHIAYNLVPFSPFNIHNHNFIQIPFNFFYKESSSLFVKPSVFQPPQLA